MTFTVMSLADRLGSLWNSLLTTFTHRTISTTADGSFFRTLSDLANLSDKYTVPVSPQTVSSIATAGACMKVLAETIAMLPFGVYREENGIIKEDFTDPVYQLLHNQPHPNYSSFSFREGMMYNMLQSGNAVAIINQDRLGIPTSFQVVPYDQVTPILYEGRMYYDIPKLGKTISQDYVIHIPYNSHNSLWGISPIQQYRELFGEVLSVIKYNFEFYKNGVRTSGVLSADKALSQDVFDRLRESFGKEYAGARNSGKPILLEEGLKYNPITVSQSDAQYMENRKFSKQEISSIYRVPLHLINSLERSTDNNIEHQGIDFVTHTILPIVKRWEQEFNRKLFGNQSGPVRKYVRFNLDGLLRGDFMSRTEGYSKLFMIGVLSQNDIRRLENMNPITGGDVYYRPLNMIDSSITPKEEQALRFLTQTTQPSHNGHTKEYHS